MGKQILETEHAKVFLDVVFGVIIALPMAELPVLVYALAMAPSRALWIPVLLLSSAITFCAFYWLEVRRFIEEQAAFNSEVNRLQKHSLDLIDFSLMRLVGSLVAIVLVAAILKYAELNLFRAFLLASAIFWLLDFAGNIEGNLIYQKHKNVYELVRGDCPPELESYVRRFGTPFFLADGLFTMALCVALLLVDRKLKINVQLVHYRFWASLGILVLTLFRHLIWRTKVYEWRKGIN